MLLKATRQPAKSMRSRVVSAICFSGVLGAVSACTAAPPAIVAASPLPAARIAAPVAVAPAVVAVAAAEPVAVAPSILGVASWYRTGKGLRRTYTGQLLDDNALTAASPALPMGTVARIRRVDGGGSVVVLVNDRMPRCHRVIDLSEAAARELGLMESGVATVTVTPIVLAENP